MQRAVVTGGLGFIGSHVVDALVADGRDVTIVDSMVAAVTDGREYEAVGCVVHRVSIADFLAGAARFEGADLVVHAAIARRPGRHPPPPGHARRRHRRARRSWWSRSASSTTSRSSRSARPRSTAAAGCCRRATTSSCRSHYNVRLEYAIAKTLTEAVTINSRHRGLRGLVIRPFNVAGPRQSRAGGFVMPTFVQQALAGRPLTVFAGGEQERAFLSRRSTSRASSPSTLDAGARVRRPIFNLGNPHQLHDGVGPGRADRQRLEHAARRSSTPTRG